MNYEDFVKNSVIESESEIESLSTFQERDEALIRLYQNVHSKQQIISELGRKFKSNIKDLGVLCHSLKYMYYKPETVNSISTTGKLAETFGSQRNASRVLEKACKIGLLEEVNGKYSYCSETTTSIHFSPRAKEYVCNKVVREIIEEIIKENNIEIKEINKIKNIEDYNKIYKYTVVDTFAPDYKITSKTKIANKTDEEILIGLYNHYPYIAEFQKLADEINERTNANELSEIKFKFNIKRTNNNVVTKIGLRATNSAVSFKVHENEHKEYKGVWRKDYLISELGNDYQEYDVHSSISNVTYLLNNGCWLGIDCYSEEWGKPWGQSITRDWFKTYFMKHYFNPSLDSLLKSLFPTSTEIRKQDYYINCTKSISSGIENFIGPSFGSEIFLHESCIYLLVRKELMNRNIKCVQIYDGFYFKKGEMPEDMDKIVNDCAMNYYTNYYISNRRVLNEQ